MLLGSRERFDAATVYLILHGGLAFLFALSFTINLVYQVESVGLDPLQLVLVGTFLELVCFLSETPTGIVADIYSRRLSIVIGVTIVGIGFIIEGAFPTFYTVLLAQLVWGFGWTFVSGAEAAWIADEVGSERAGRVFMRGAQVGSIGGLVAAPFSVALASVALWLPIVTSGVLLILFGLLLALVMPERGFTRAERVERDTLSAMRATLLDGVTVIRKRPVLLTVIAVSLVFGLFSEGFDRLWTAHLLQSFSLPSIGPFKPVVWFGILAVATSLLSIAGNELVRRRVDLTQHRGVTRSLFVSDGLLIGGLAVFALSGNVYVAIAAFLLASASREVHYPLATAWANQSIDSRVRATVLSINSQMNAFGQVAGGPVIGLIGRAVSLRAALLAASLVLTPVLFLYARTLGKHQPKDVGEAAPAEAVAGE